MTVAHNATTLGRLVATVAALVVLMLRRVDVHGIDGTSRLMAGLVVIPGGARSAESRNFRSSPSMAQASRLVHKPTQMALIPQMAQIGSASRTEFICVI